MKVIQWIRNLFLGIIGVAIVGYAGACVYANFIAGDGKVEPPKIEKARYAVQLTSTGQVFFSDKVDDRGTLVTLYNYYEYDGKKFLYRKATLPLDEKYFGRIDVVRRQTE